MFITLEEAWACSVVYNTGSCMSYFGDHSGGGGCCFV